MADDYEKKYWYLLNGTLYFVVLTAKEKMQFEDKYGVTLHLTDDD